MSEPRAASPDTPSNAMATRWCPVCNARYEPDRHFCAKDGAELRKEGGAATLVEELVAGRYLVRERLGSGGMGAVYRAEQLGLGRTCALKVIHRDAASDPDMVTRFHREARNASRIAHPNVVSVFDFGSTPDGRLFLAMEFVSGEALSALLAREGALSPPRAAELVRQIADALDAAGEAGVVHRDLKPDNVMLARRRDGGDLVKVVDFGIAKALSENGQTVTATGMIIGTPTYMSPEQVGAERTLDGRSDQYALGLIAFEMLTGRRAFPARQFGEATKRLVVPPPRLTEAGPGRDWLPAVQEVLDRVLQVDRERRYGSSTEFAHALVAAVAGAAAPAVSTGAPTAGPPTAPASVRTGPAGTANAGVPTKPAPAGDPAVATTRGLPLRRALAPISATLVVAAGIVAGGWLLLGRRAPDVPMPRAELPSASPRGTEGTPVLPRAPLPGGEAAAAPAARAAEHPGAAGTRPTRPTESIPEPVVRTGAAPGAVPTGPVEGAAAAPPPSPATAPTTSAEAGAELTRLSADARRESLPPGEARATARALVALLPRLATPRDSAAAMYHAAELLYLQLDDAAEACRLLRGVERTAAGTSYARAIGAYLQPGSPLGCR